MSENLENYVKGRLSNLIETSIAFEKEVVDSEKSIQRDQLELKSRKKDNPDLKPSDIKDEILDINKRFYRMQLLDQNLRNTACAITELSILSKSLGLNIEFDGKSQEVYELLSHDNRDLFILEKGEVVPIDGSEYSNLEGVMLDRASSEESLQNSFNLI